MNGTYHISARSGHSFVDLQVTTNQPSCQRHTTATPRQNMPKWTPNQLTQRNEATHTLYEIKNRPQDSNLADDVSYPHVNVSTPGSSNGILRATVRVLAFYAAGIGGKRK